MTTPKVPREDITAAMAARRELGPDYDEAFIESVVQRIEESLDARAAAAPRPGPRAWPAPEPRRGGGERDHSLGVAVLSLLAAIPLSAIGAVNAGVPGLLLALTAIVLVNFTYTFRPRR